MAIKIDSEIPTKGCCKGLGVVGKHNSIGHSVFVYQLAFSVIHGINKGRNAQDILTVIITGCKCRARCTASFSDMLAFIALLSISNNPWK